VRFTATKGELEMAPKEFDVWENLLSKLHVFA